MINQPKKKFGRKIPLKFGKIQEKMQGILADNLDELDKLLILHKVLSAPRSDSVYLFTLFVLAIVLLPFKLKNI